MTLLQKSLIRPWSFSGLTTMVRIVLMYYINLNTFFEKPEENLKRILLETAEPPPITEQFYKRGLSIQKNHSTSINKGVE